MIEQSIPEAPHRDGSADALISRERALFLLLGPTSVALVAALTILAVVGPCMSGAAIAGGTMLFLFDCLVSLVAKPFDRYLFQALPILLRVPATATVGAMIGGGLVLAIVRIMLPWWILAPFALSGAYCAGLMSAFSRDISR